MFSKMKCFESWKLRKVVGSTTFLSSEFGGFKKVVLCYWTLISPWNVSLRFDFVDVASAFVAIVNLNAVQVIEKA